VSTTTDASPRLARSLLLALSLACGVAVANVYFPQALSPLVAAGLHVSPSAAALVATAAQLGYAAGIFLLVPLGDRFPQRWLIVVLLGCTALGLLAAGCAPGLAVLVGASAVVGVTTVVPQIIIPMAAGLVADGRRAATTGTLLSGLLGGILLARTFGGVLGEWLGWRAPYLVAAGLAVVFAVVVAVAAPVTSPPTRERYPALLATAVRLLRTEPELRRSCLYQAALFAGFSAAWTNLALLVTGPHYHLDASAVGLIALVGAVGVVSTPVVGRWIDRRGPDPVNLVGMITTLAAAAVLVGGVLDGVVGLVALVAGMLLLDTAVQCGQVANQARIFALAPRFRSRLNTAYMTCSFLGGSVGSWLGVQIYVRIGWAGVCAMVAVLAGIVLGRHLLSGRGDGR
jgi:predicted MFS family arabinose efflux permease